MRHSKYVIQENIIHFPKLNINFWAMNKNASSTFLEHFAKLSKYDFTYNDDGQGAKIYLKKNDHYIDYETAKSNGSKNVTVVRNPFKRFESCYRMWKYPVNKTQAKASDKGNFEPHWEANDLLRAIDRKFNFREKRGNKHYWKQIWFVHDTSIMDHIVKLEDIARTWDLDIPYPEFHTNQSGEKKTPLDYDKDFCYNIYREDFKTFGYAYRRTDGRV